MTYPHSLVTSLIITKPPTPDDANLWAVIVGASTSSPEYLRPLGKWRGGGGVKLLSGRETLVVRCSLKWYWTIGLAAHDGFCEQIQLTVCLWRFPDLGYTSVASSGKGGAAQEIERFCSSLPPSLVSRIREWPRCSSLCPPSAVLRKRQLGVRRGGGGREGCAIKTI